MLHGVLSMEDIPYRDCFAIHDRWVVTPCEDGVDVAFEFEVKWSKSTIFKRKIESFVAERPARALRRARGGRAGAPRRGAVVRKVAAAAAAAAAAGQPIVPAVGRRRGLPLALPRAALAPAAAAARPGPALLEVGGPAGSSGGGRGCAAPLARPPRPGPHGSARARKSICCVTGSLFEVKAAPRGRAGGGARRERAAARACFLRPWTGQWCRCRRGPLATRADASWSAAAAR